MIYSYDTRVSFEKVGNDGRADIGGILDYLNECCFFHAQDVGRGVYHESKPVSKELKME